MNYEPLISNLSISGIPEFARFELGEKALARAIHAAGIDFESIADQQVFVPQSAILRFVEATARAAGEENLGLMLTPAMDIAGYGLWSDYLLGANSLGQALESTVRTIGFHSTGDTVSITLAGDQVRFAYRLALAGHTGYQHASCAAAGLVQSICRRYTSNAWKPSKIELDIARPRRGSPFEDVFQCPVTYDAPCVTVVFDRHYLTAGRLGRQPKKTVTIEDVARFTRGGAPEDLLGTIAEQIRLQVFLGSTSIVSAAQLIGTSVRTLQRELNRAGTDFRTMANAVRTQRAMELLRHGNTSITRISSELGYSAPAHFARAFRKATGLSPREYRSTVRKI